MVRSYWLKFGACVAFLVLFAASAINGRWYDSLGWPWNGLFQIGIAVAEVASPLVFIYLVIVASRHK